MHASLRCLQTLHFCNSDLGEERGGTHDRQFNTAPSLPPPPQPPLPGAFSPCRAAELRSRSGAGVGPRPRGVVAGRRRRRRGHPGRGRAAPCTGQERPLQSPGGKPAGLAGDCRNPGRAGGSRLLRAPRRGGAVACGVEGGGGVGGGLANALQRVLISFRSFCSSRRGNPLPPPPSFPPGMLALPR